jgi:SynChlorMet cassette radical SAM/SPASM protein ScmE
VYAHDFEYGPDLDTDEWLTFFDEIERLKIFRVKISGGEPFLRGDIFTLLDSLYSKPLRLSINTNATLIDEDAAKRLSGYVDKLDDIMVSLDGATPKTHDALRGSGAFETTLRGIQLLAKHVGNITAYATVTRLNFHELPAVAELARDLGIVGLKFNHLLLEGRGLVFQDELALGARETQHIIEELKRIREKFPFVSGTFFEMDEIFEGVRSLCSERCKEVDMPAGYITGCGALIDQCSIRPDGWAVPCDRLPELVAGKINETPLDKIWTESETFVDFRKRTQTPLESLETCRGCEFSPLCTGGCAASAYYSEGTIFARDPDCCYKRYREDLFDAR